MRRFKIIASWIAVALVMYLIFHLSHQEAVQSSELSESFISRLYRMYINFTGREYSDVEFAETVASVEFLVRKLAHFGIYLALGFLFSNAFYQHGIQKNSKILLYAQSSSTFYAITDEIHQLFVVGRSGNIRDVFIDSFGALTGILLFLLLIFLRRFLWTSQKR